MDSVFENICDFCNGVARSTSGFTPETWATLAVATVVLGYFLLRGNLTH